jgi:hypothetical protein
MTLKDGLDAAPWSHVLWTNLGGGMPWGDGDGDAFESVRCLRAAMRLSAVGGEEWHMALSLIIKAAERMAARGGGGKRGGRGGEEEVDWGRLADSMRKLAAARDTGPEYGRVLAAFGSGGDATWLFKAQRGAIEWAGEAKVGPEERMLQEACALGGRGKGVLMFGCIVRGNTRDGMWGPGSMEAGGIGGSEQAVIHVSREMQALGWQVWRSRSRALSLHRFAPSALLCYLQDGESASRLA